MRSAMAPYEGLLAVVEAQQAPGSGAEPCLWFDGEQLQLMAGNGGMQAWVTTEEVTKRAAGASLLARACNLTPRQPLRLLDAMAGWGVDGLALQLRGAQVLQVERNPAAWALLADLRRRFGFSSDPQALLCADAWQVLGSDATATVDVVYLDPMFAARKKTALPSKRLQLLAQVTAMPSYPEPAMAGWIERAQRKALSRVVIKRRLKDPPLQPKPAWQLKGKTVRYDCYPGLAAASA